MRIAVLILVGYPATHRRVVQAHCLNPPSALTKKSTVEATLNHATRIGSVVRLGLSRTNNWACVEVELSRERFDHLNVATGNVVYFKTRRARVFLAENHNSDAA